MSFITINVLDSEELTGVHIINLNCVTDIYMEKINVNGEKKVSQIVLSLSNGENVEFTGQSAIQIYKELKVNGVIK